MNLLEGLGSDYNAVVTAINIRDDKILVEAIHIMLLAFENRLEQQSSADQISIITGVVEGNIMVVEGTTTQATLQMPAITTTEVVVVGADIHRIEDIIQSVQKSHNVSYVVNLALQYMSAITDLIFPIKTLQTVVLTL
jgi:hypothetical protein